MDAHACTLTGATCIHVHLCGHTNNTNMHTHAVVSPPTHVTLVHPHTYTHAHRPHADIHMSCTSGKKKPTRAMRHASVRISESFNL